jgi:homoserine O-acetyltransferase
LCPWLTFILDGHHSMPERLPNQLYTTIDEFKLESGEVLTGATIALTIRGRLNASRTNVIVICHALSGSADCSDWWSLLLSSPTKPALDLTRFCIICCNVLGSPYGSSSPLSSRPNSTSSYGNTFPKTTIRDDVR